LGVDSLYKEARVKVFVFYLLALCMLITSAGECTTQKLEITKSDQALSMAKDLAAKFGWKLTGKPNIKLVKVDYLGKCWEIEYNPRNVDRTVMFALGALPKLRVHALDFSGYELSGDQSSVKGCTVSTNSALNVITFYYTRTGVSVRVVYLDENEKYIDETKNKAYDVTPGAVVTENFVYFDGYTLSDDEVKTVTVNEPTLISFLYKQSDRYKITVK
jgi:hypothetical protein